jgi:hypothetical protein
MLPGLLPARPLSRRVQWWVSFALFTLVVSTWALANPLFAGPDEHDHVRRASSVAHGELIGPTGRGTPDHIRFVKVPGPFARATTPCFAFKADMTAACEFNIDPGDKGTVRVPLPAGRYPPIPFAAVGLPSVPWPSTFGVYAMRVLGSALCGALMASALLSLREARVPWLATSGLAFALTPMVFFMASMVNPNNLEIAGGIGVWASAVVLAAKAREGVVESRLVARTAIAAGVLVLARPLGMLWLAVAAVVVLLTCTRAALRLLIQSKVARIWGGIVALCIGFELAWITFYDTLASKAPLGESADGLSNVEVLKRTLGYTNRSYTEMIGRFGWVDTPVPSLTLVLWTAALGLLVALGLGLTRRRMAVSIAALLGLVVVVPAVLEFIEARRFGFGWQGRYTLPLAVGLPILCGFALAQESRRILPRGRLAIVLGIAFVVAHFLAFGENLRRYTVGINGPLTFWLDADWSPPLRSSLLLVAFAVLLVALALWLWGDTASREDAASPVAPESQ